jgi:uncharacterized protein YndB with AHSA1/START domain
MGNWKTRRIFAVIVPALTLLSACARTTLSDTIVVSVVIKAPVERVFSYVNDFKNLPEYAPAWTLTNLQGSGLGATFDWSLTAGGKSIRGSALTVDYVPNQRVVNISSGDVQGTETYLYFPVPEGTKLIYAMAYSIEVPLFTKRVAAKAIRENTQADLKRLKAVMEKQALKQNPAPATSGESLGESLAGTKTLNISDTFIVSLEIKAPVEKVFSYMNQHCSEWHGSKISNVQGEGLGRTSDYLAEWPGISGHGKIVVVEYVPNQKVVEFIRGDGNGGTWFNLENYLWLPIEGGTKLVITSYYYMANAKPTPELKEYFKREKYRKSVV